MINNPILSGFNSDPCICKRGDDFYLAVSSFEWFPGVPVYHSKDLKNWELITHILNTQKLSDLRRLPSAKGVWAPCLTWCETEKLFYLVYSCMNSGNARFFDVDNFVITAPDITGPWSEPVYIHSAGFDPSVLHDDDGRKYIVSLEWETREGYFKPGFICIVEYDAAVGHVVGYPKRIWQGGTKRGCVEGPHLCKINGWYYLICAEGGTGYGHCVTVARAKNVFGPYENCPYNPILTSTADFDEMDNDDFLKPQRYNPYILLQKAGHGSLIETNGGEWYMVHHCSRPFTPELRCTLGRETAIQRMKWTEDGWPVLDSNANLALEYTAEPDIPEFPFEKPLVRRDFSVPKMPIDLYSPRIDSASFTSFTEKEGWLAVRGQESLSSTNRVSFLGHKLTSLNAYAQIRMDMDPEVYQEYAGICIYYDNLDFIMLRKSWSDKKKTAVLDMIRVNNGEYSELISKPVELGKKVVSLRVEINGRETRFFWSADETEWHSVGDVYNTSEFSDEYCKNSDMTGAFLGIACVDGMLHEKRAFFKYFDYEDR